MVLCTPSLGKITFPLVLQYVDDMVTVSEATIINTMFFLDVLCFYKAIVNQLTT